MDTITDPLAAHPFLAGLPADWLARLAVHATRVSFHTNDRVFAEGAAAERFWLIRRGQVGLTMHMPGRGEVLIDKLGGDTVLGWSWLFPPYRWRFGATAADLTSAISFDATTVRRLCEEDPALGHELTRRFMAVVLNRLQATRVRLLELYE
jgi:CRP/FNR family cyclic AMP-dependent transcriptional regulator